MFKIWFDLLIEKWKMIDRLLCLCRIELLERAKEEEDKHGGWENRNYKGQICKIKNYVYFLCLVKNKLDFFSFFLSIFNFYF